jgi:hypothetical protein
MSVRVGDVEKALAPVGVAGRAVGPAAGGDQPCMEGVDFGVIEDEAPPPRPLHLGRLKDQVEKIVAGAETGEACLLAAMDDRQIEETVKFDGAPHVVRRQGDRTDAFDHRTAPSSSRQPASSPQPHLAPCRRLIR